MKWLLVISLFFSTKSWSQSDSAYSRLLKSTTELDLEDSMKINAALEARQRIDTNDMKAYFTPILGSTQNNRLKNRMYSFAGKITINPRFDLLIVVEEKKKTDSSGSTSIYLVTFKKQGRYIASLEAAATSSVKNYSISSWLFPTMQVRKNSTYMVNEQLQTETDVYSINGGGRFILASKE